MAAITAEVACRTRKQEQGLDLDRALQEISTGGACFGSDGGFPGSQRAARLHENGAAVAAAA